MFSFLAGLIFLAGFAAHIALSSRYVLTQRSIGNEVGRNTLRWNALYGIALLGLAVWGFVGLIDNRFFAPIAPLFVAPAIVALSQVVIRREELFARFRALDVTRRHKLEWGLFILYGVLSMLMLEWPWSWAVCLYGPTYWWLEMALLMLVTGFF